MTKLIHHVFPQRKFKQCFVVKLSNLAFVPKFCTGRFINVLVFKNFRHAVSWAVNHLKLWQRHIPRHLYGVEPVVPLVTNITHRITNWKQTESGWGGQALRWTYSFLSQCSTIGCPWGSIGGPWDRMLWWWVWKQKCLIEDFVCVCVCIEGSVCNLTTTSKAIILWW